MMDQNFSGDEEESDEDNEEEQMETGDSSSELLDSGDFSDSKDHEWLPSKRAKKVEKGKGMDVVYRFNL